MYLFFLAYLYLKWFDCFLLAALIHYLQIDWNVLIILYIFKDILNLNLFIQRKIVTSGSSSSISSYLKIKSFLNNSTNLLHIKIFCKAHLKNLTFEMPILCPLIYLLDQRNLFLFYTIKLLKLCHYLIQQEATLCFLIIVFCKIFQRYCCLILIWINTILAHQFLFFSNHWFGCIWQAGYYVVSL